MPKAKIQVKRVEAPDYPAWRTVLASSPEGSPYQLPEFLEALAVATGGSVRLLGLYRDTTELVGGIGLYLQPNPLGLAATSRLMLYYNGPFLKPAAATSPHRRESYRRQLLGVLEEELRQQDLEQVRFKTREVEHDYRTFIDRGWCARPFYSYSIPLTNLDHQWTLVDKNLRRMIRRARDLNLSFTERGDFDSFFDMHEETHRRKRSPIYLARSDFRQFVTNLVDHDIARLFQVSLPSGEPIASQLVLFCEHPTAHTLAAAAFSAHQQTGCNALLRWQTCEWLSGRGHTALDLTDAHNTGVAKFKCGLGATLTMGLDLQLQPRLSVRMLYGAGAFLRRAGHKIRRTIPRSPPR